MSLFRAACTVSDGLTRFNRHPITVLLFPALCALVVFFGWMIGQLELALLSLTTILSVDASWSARLVMLKQGQEAGEVAK